MTDLDPRDLDAEERSQLAIDADNEERAWLSGWCNAGASHGNCAGVVESAGKRLRCRCACHIKTAEPEQIKVGLHWDLDNSLYHSLTDWFSSTQLKHALPEEYKDGGSQEALDFGTLVHAVVLEPDNLGHYVTLDATAIAGNNPKTGKPYDHPQMTSRFKAAKAEAEQDGKTVVSQEDWDRAHAMRDAVYAHDEGRRLLFDTAGMAEESAFAVDENGIKHKARFDRHIDTEIIDLKTTSGRPGRRATERTIIDYGYDLSAAHYLEVADLLDLGVERFTWVFVAKTAPYRVTVCDVDAEFIDRGRILRQRSIDRLTDQTVELYEGASGRLHLTLPPWARLSAPTGIPDDFEWSLNDYDHA